MTDVLHDIQILLQLRVRLMSRLLLPNFTTASQRAAPVRLVAVVAGTALVLLGVSWVLGSLFVRALLGHPAGPLFLPAMTWAASAAAVGIFFYAGLTLSGMLTHRNELTVLLHAPLSPQVILADRVLAVAGSFGVLLAVIGLPNLFGAGHALHAGLVFDLTCLAVVFLLPVAPVAGGLLLVVVVLRCVPPRHARLVSAVASILASAVLYLVTETNGGWHAFPGLWPGAALAAAGRGQDGAAGLYLIGTAVWSALLSAAAVGTASRLLSSGWATYTEIGRTRTTRGKARGDGPADLPPPTVIVGTPWSALFRKEWLVARRDPKLIAQLAYPLLLEGYTLYRAVGNPLTVHPLTGRLERLFATSLYLSASLTALFLLTILALPTVSREGRSLYLLGISPVRPRDILVVKIIVCAAPVLGLLEVVLLTAGTRLLGLTLQQTVFDALVFAVLLLALASWLVCVGVVWPRPTTDGSRRQIHGMALLIGPTTGAVLCALVGWLLALAYTAPERQGWVAPIAALSIFALTGCVIAGVLITGPRLLQNLMTGDRRPA